MLTLRSAVIRLAQTTPGLRLHLLPLVVREAKSTGIRPESKDHMRIKDMVSKARDDAHLLQLAENMAKAITDGPKAMRRARAAEAVKQYDVADIFYNRAHEIGY